MALANLAEIEPEALDAMMDHARDATGFLKTLAHESRSDDPVLSRHGARRR